MKILETNRRNSLAARHTGLAISSLGLLLPAVLLDLPSEERTLLAFAAMAGYGYFARRAMLLWQGRRWACRGRSKSWRRRFCDERTNAVESDWLSEPIHSGSAHGVA